MPLEFSEYVYAKTRYGALPQVPQGQEIANQSIAIGAGSVQSAAFNARTDLIVISKVDADARIAFGTNPTAVVGGAGQTRYLKAGNEYAFSVEPLTKIAVINA
jgi:hypothetical protein